ncbi:MAG TPA: hypothetical protein VNJ09_10340 [Chthonomonadales bacterium]|nr:hypothetical protein [Chthonomonadales bacterium]
MVTFNITLQNRIYNTGHVPAFAVGDYPTERYRLYEVEKAKGGVRLTIFGGSTSVSPNSLATVADAEEVIQAMLERLGTGGSWLHHRSFGMVVSGFPRATLVDRTAHQEV